MDAGRIAQAPLLWEAHSAVAVQENEELWRDEMAYIEA